LSNPWPNCSDLPASARAILSALHRTDPDFTGLDRLNDAEWREALAYCDRSRLTLPLREIAGERVPPWVRDRLDRNAAANRTRMHGIEQDLRSIRHWLDEAGIEFVPLKGHTHTALFGSTEDSRVQYDIDLWLPHERVHDAQAVMVSHGYVPMAGMESSPTDHLPALIRQTGWQWAGDYFDPQIPVAVELHFRLWNPALERVDAPDTEAFWERRCNGMLHRADALAFAALHALKHLLRGKVTPFHVYEIAGILDSSAADDPFWEEWLRLHPDGLRRLEAVAFRLAREWFGGQIAPAAQAQIDQLPTAVQVWFQEFAIAPAISPFHSNKDELWLHLSLVDSKRDAWNIVCRRFAPRHLPALNTTAFIADSELTRRQRIRQQLARLAFTIGRARHHALSLPATARSGARWWWLNNPLGRQFWLFLAAALILNFGLFVFVLLYNLFLLDLGFKEDFIGVVNASQRAGSLAGTIPAAWMAHRAGWKKCFLGAIAGIAGTEVLRALIGARLPLAALAFASGCIFATWAVILAPAIAAAVDEKHRPAAFSVFFAANFAVGITGNWVGGRLPLWMHGKQPVLLLSAAIVAAALIPACRLRDVPAAAPGERVYPRSPFLVRFLAPFFLWHLATGAFNPFGNLYFSRLGFAVERIGSIFSGSQLVQVLTVLTAPWLTRRLGLLRGIVCMMAATAAGLCGLAVQQPGAAAVTAYVAYMSFQWMSEPGLNSLLMNNVQERERSGASSLSFLAAFGAQMLAAYAAGKFMQAAGYGPVLFCAAVLAVLAAILFQWLLGRPIGSSKASTSR
jgi:MFS family permease